LGLYCQEPSSCYWPISGISSYISQISHFFPSLLILVLLESCHHTISINLTCDQIQSRCPKSMPSERSYSKYPVVVQDSRRPTSELFTSRSSSSSASSKSSSYTSNSTYNMGGLVHINQAPRDTVREGGHRESVYRVPGGMAQHISALSFHLMLISFSSQERHRHQNFSWPSECHQPGHEACGPR
jgi:hypothetical protein